MAEAAFSSDGKYYSCFSQDGRLRIWDTETSVLKQEYTPDLHLTAPPSCLQWISVSQTGGGPKGGRRKSVSGEQETQCIALGTSSGKILLYSVTQAKVETVLEDKSSELRKNNITSLDWHRKYGLYSCNKDSVIYEWDLQSGGVRNKYKVIVDNKNKQSNNISAIKVIPHNQKTSAKYLITASTQLRVWRLLGSAEVVKCLGNNAAPKALLTLAEFNNLCWLIEGSQNERLLSFWDVTITEDMLQQMNGEDSTPNRKKRKKSTSSPSIVPSPTYMFVLEDAPKQLDVTIRNETEGTRLSLCAVTRSGVAHYYEHLLNGASTKPVKPSLTIQAATASATPLSLQCCRITNSGVTLGYNIGAKLVFENVTPDLKSKTQVLIRGDVKEPKKRQAKSGDVSMATDDVTYADPLPVAKKRTTAGHAVEVPMEERLANLTVDSKERGQVAISQNLTKLLMQGLHSKDKRVLQSVIQSASAKCAKVTVSGLPARYVAPLLEHLADVSGRNTQMCASVCRWAMATVHWHAAVLLAAGNSPQLANLLAICSQRRSHLCQLLNLKGRLELTMAQRESINDTQIAQKPILEYNDSSSESEMEMERAPSSDHSWADSDALASGDEQDDEQDDGEDEDDSGD